MKDENREGKEPFISIYTLAWTPQILRIGQIIIFVL